MQPKRKDDVKFEKNQNQKNLQKLLICIKENIEKKLLNILKEELHPNAHKDTED